MEEGDGARRPELISSGRIEDAIANYIPAFRQPHRGIGGEEVAYIQILSYRTVSASFGLPVLDPDRMVLHVPEERSFWERSEIRDLALDAARRRANDCIDQFLYFFLVDDRGTPDPAVHRVTARAEDHSLLVIDPGYQEPPGIPAGEVWYYIDIPVRVAWRFSRHIYNATMRTWEPTPARLRIPRPPPQLGVTGDAVPSVCGQCGRATWFRPCCGVFFCRRCSTATTHQDDCAAPAQSVPVPRIFRTEGGERVPSIFVDLPHPSWQQYRYVSGVRFVLSSYYNTADAYFFDSHRGIRFQVHLYRREGPGGWSYRLDFVFRLRPTGNIHIRWNLYIAPHYATLWPGLALGI